MSFALLGGLLLLGGAFAQDIPLKQHRARCERYGVENANPECAWHIRYINNHWQDDEGTKVIDYIAKHSYYDETEQQWHKMLWDEAVCRMAMAQCARHNVKWSWSEAMKLCPCSLTYKIKEQEGLIWKG